jgi:protein phosphatase
MGTLTYFAESFVGRRKNNQDACTVYDLGNESYLLAVADGMGGSVGGQIASNLILDYCKDYLKNEFDQEVKPENLKQVLTRLFSKLQSVIYEKIQAENELAGMGTTLTCVLIKDNKYAWGNIGDSRTYLLNSDMIEQISVDHTYIQDYKKENDGPIPENILQQYSHYLTKALDGGSDSADIFPEDSEYNTINEGDAFLLCSDGLISNKFETDTELLHKYVIGSDTLEQAAKNLICSAFHDGSNDNISIVLAEYGKMRREKIKLKKYSYPPGKKNSINLIADYWKLVIPIILLIILLLIIYL